MSSDTPLYCECGNRLGLRRSDGVFASVHRGRIITMLDLSDNYRIRITCEDCQRTTSIDKLATAKLS